MLPSKLYLAGLAVIALLGLAMFLIVIFRLDPFVSPVLAIPFFFLALFFTLVGFLALFGFYGRVWFRKGEIYVGHITIAVRQAFLLTIAIEVALAFEMLNILTWWDGLLIALAISLVEIYFANT